jgi:hypothetical protein
MIPRYQGGEPYDRQKTAGRQENALEQAKIAVAAQLEQTGQDFPQCDCCRPKMKVANIL